jgi:hypothetical protein
MTRIASALIQCVILTVNGWMIRLGFVVDPDVILASCCETVRNHGDKVTLRGRFIRELR